MPGCCFHSAYTVNLAGGGWTNRQIGWLYNGLYCDDYDDCVSCDWPEPYRPEECEEVYSCCSAVAGRLLLQPCGYLTPQQCGMDTSVPWYPAISQCCGGLWYYPRTVLCERSVCYCEDLTQYLQAALGVDCNEETQQWRLGLRLTTWLAMFPLTGGLYCTAVYYSAWASYPKWYSALADQNGEVTLSKAADACGGGGLLCNDALPDTIVLSPSGSFPPGCEGTTTTTTPP